MYEITYICKKCHGENYREGDDSVRVCILSVEPENNPWISDCKGVLEKAKVYECEECIFIKIVPDTVSFCKCPYCDESMNRRGKK